MLDLHLVLVTLHNQFSISIEEKQIELVTLNTICSLIHLKVFSWQSGGITWTIYSGRRPEDVGKITWKFGASSIFLTFNYEAGTNTREPQHASSLMKSRWIIWETCGGGPNYLDCFGYPSPRSIVCLLCIGIDSRFKV